MMYLEMARETYERMLRQPRDASEVRMVPLPSISTDPHPDLLLSAARCKARYETLRLLGVDVKPLEVVEIERRINNR